MVPTIDSDDPPTAPSRPQADRLGGCRPMRRGSSSASLTSSTASSHQAPSESETTGGGLLSSMPSFPIPSLRRRRPRGSRRHWVDDQKVDACMLCSAPFTLTYRKHHCRRCGQVICTKCSHFVEAQLVFQNGPPAAAAATTTTTTAEPVNAALTAVATAPAVLLPKDTTRVCGPCGASLTKVVHDPAAQAKAAVNSAILATPAYVFALYDKKEELAIGSLSVVVVQARGLPAADRNGLSDPYAKVVMTGLTISGGQEWPEAMQSAKRTATRFATLNPIWKEHFVLRVPRAEAVLRIEVKDYDFPAITDDSLGQAAIPLSDLQHQRRVDKWYPLVGDDGEEQGEVRLILQYRFNRWGEALSRFWAEPLFVPDWPGFSPNRTFEHIKNLILETQLYTAFLQSIAAVLTWERPLWTLAWLGIVLGLTWYPRYIYSGLQVLLALHLVATYIRRRGRAQTLELEQATAGRRRLTIRELVKQRRLRAVLRGGMSDTDHMGPEEAPEPQPQADRGSSGRDAAGDGADKKAAAAEEEKRRQQQQQLDEQEGIKSLGFLLNFLGKRLGRSEATTNVQNVLGLLVTLLRGVRHLLEWEYPPVTLAFFFMLLGSAALHVFFSTTYLFIIAELAVFRVLTWPLSTFVWVTVRSLKVMRSLATQLGYTLKRGAVEGQMSDEAFAIEVQGLAAPTEAVGVDAGGFGEAKTGEGEAGQ